MAVSCSRPVLGLVALVALVALAGCQKPEKALTARDWVARGDAAIASDPGRALADYRRAGEVRGSSPELSAVELSQREKKAAQAWLEREVATRFTPTETPEHTLAHVDALRATARAEKVAEAIEPALVAREKAACEALLPRVRAAAETASKGDLGAIVALDGLAAAVPSRCDAARAEVAREIEAKRATLVARFEERVRESGARPSRALRARLVAAAKSVPKAPERVALEPSLGRKHRIAWDVATRGCTDADDALSSLRGARDGDHRGSMRLELTCEASEGTKDVVEYEEVQRQKTETYEETKRECSQRTTHSGPSRCTEREPTNGVCKRWESTPSVETTCNDVPVTKTRKVTVTEKVPHKRKVTVGRASAKGTVVLEVDGATRSIPVSASREDVSERAARAAVGRAIAVALEGAAADAKKAIVREELAAVDRKAASGDIEGALDDATALLVEGTPPSTAVAEAAARADGLSREEWTAMVVDQRIPSYPAVDTSALHFAAVVAKPVPGDPDKDGVALDRRVADRAHEAKSTREDLADANATRLGYTLGVDHWDPYGGSAGAGAILGLRLAGGGNDDNPYYFYDGTLDFESNIGAGLGLGVDALLKFGGGFRSKHVWLEPFVVGGVDGRGSQDSALYVPLGLEAGFGARLVFPLGSDTRLELHAARISRPLRETGDATDGPLLQRIVYDVRLAFGVREEVGVRGTCSFFQTRANDWVFPSDDIRSRACGLGLFAGF